MSEMVKIESAVVLGQCVLSLEELKNVCEDLTSTTRGNDAALLWFLCETFLKGEFCQVFSDDRVKELTKVSFRDGCFKQLCQKCADYLQNDNSYVRQLTVLLIGASALKLFIQSNWTGPAVSENQEIFTDIPGDECHRLCVGELEMNGEPCYRLIEEPAFLIVAKAFLVNCRALLSSCSTAEWWAYRCAFVHQLILLDRSFALYKEIGECLSQVEESALVSGDDAISHKAKMQFYMEAAMAHLYYFEVTKCRSYLDKAKLLSHFDFELTGALGKRTYHQETALSQLVLSIQRKGICLDELRPACPLDQFPKNLPLKDDTVMNQIKFDHEVPPNACLTPEEQCLILTTCILNKRISAPEALRDEEMMAYIDRVLSTPLAWSVQFSALFQRCRLETKSSRRVERSMSQLQGLVDSVKASGPHAGIRQELFFCSRPPTVWNIEKELGQLFFSLGATKSALDVFLKYELWEEVISCYTKIDRRDRAEAVVRKLLEQEETAHLYCLLGDATQDPQHFEKAWEISNHTSSRAQRSLGLMHYHKKEFKDAIPYLEKSVELNGIQMNVWFALGYSAMQVEDYPLCVKAYKRVVNLDSDSFEAWNNMASAYIHMGDKPKAWKVLQESLKCNYEDWRVWENYLLVCADVGAFEECIKAWHRLIEIKGKHADGKLAKILVKVVSEGIPDMHGKPGSYLKPKLLELFGRVTSGVTNDGEIWYCYGSLYKLSQKEDSTSEEDTERMLQFFQKSFRCLTQKQNWERDVDTCSEVLTRSKELLECYMSSAVSLSNELRRHQLLSSVRITVKGILAIVDHYKTNFSTEQLEKLEPVRNSVAEKLEQVSALTAAHD
ncbi:unnamed protein product [Ixodes hexagonus]